LKLHLVRRAFVGDESQTYSVTNTLVLIVAHIYRHAEGDPNIDQRANHFAEYIGMKSV